MTNPPLRHLVFLGMLGATLMGCWVPVETGRAMQQDLLQMQNSLSEAHKGLDQQRARLDEQLARADQQVAAVEQALAELNRAARNTDAEFGLKLERLIREVQELRGNAELADYRLTKLEGKIETAAPQTAPPSGEPSATGQKEEASAADPKDLLKQGADLAKRKQSANARGVYREIVKRWPKQEGVTDQAYYELGELYYNEKSYTSAIQEYIKIIEGFASGSLADDAYYKIALASYQLGNLEDAQIFLNEILKNHARSPLVKAARAKLDEVKKTLDKEKSSKSRKKK